MYLFILIFGYDQNISINNSLIRPIFNAFDWMNNYFVTVIFTRVSICLIPHLYTNYKQIKLGWVVIMWLYR